MTDSVDPKLTFDSFVVGPENRLAWEAARTAAELPGSAYNPLFIYSDTGLGKTHLLIAIANRARELHPEVEIAYTPLEQLLRQLQGQNGESEDYRSTEILLIDDLQFIGPKGESHQILFHLLDHLLMSGRQVALACDRPPLELGELDDRLLSRFSGGLVVDIGRPNLETRRAILELRLAAVDASLRPEVIDAIARLAIENVRQLKGALNRVLAAQKSENRDVTADEVDRLLADVVSDPELPWLAEAKQQTGAEFDDFLADVSSAVEEALGAPKWREDLARAILKWESEGYETKRLEMFLDGEEAIDSEQVIAAYERDVEKLRSIEEELRRLGTELPQDGSLRDPDRCDALRALLADVQRSDSAIDDFFLDDEKIIWEWPLNEGRLIESWDDGDKG
ncbi:MAG: ATP-binding protein [Gemmatimonadetes bacterium]|uniref:Chromosomal replication initiator protein DnaA n=1 Tax=Candidatus Kutchimonas denitrificans TaxID=3056748 RepID=A0AAE4ZAI1_9BACT|nr:ATP-binding protein [Gemmatimonadota bacterium]NIR74531.1 ATP-binding protein [Candidatus Kutchimonas denitrificans]NIS02721.1 ATP-binding protein [Gemmatimonadota bacterium]NIT68882.1 ATP-binding protein [Gemmatimonadota bacterium]NIU52187.1 ATP-binding protein [Gemmatimonadota bacterium]